MAYLSKQLDSVAKGWPPCLRALAATAFLISEKKISTAKKNVRVPHSLMTLTKYKRQYWLTNAKMVRYQNMLYKNPQVKLKVV
jgi:hypothetical protein